MNEGTFSFRARQASASLLDEFERKAGQWIAAYRRLGECRGETTACLASRLKLDSSSRFEDAQRSGEELVNTWRLGDVPADKLVAAVEEHLGILILFVDAPEGISGAACHLTDFDTILVNRHDPPGRRHFDFAHELFHAMTWESLRPERLDVPDQKKYKAKRIEQLADNFASAILMPERAMHARWNKRGKKDINTWLNATATELLVTAAAVRWRMKNLGLLGLDDELAINEARLAAHDETKRRSTPPAAFSRVFMQRIQKALEHGFISARRAARLVDQDLDGLKKLLRTHGFAPPSDL